jgi:hypothetical protein
MALRTGDFEKAEILLKRVLKRAEEIHDSDENAALCGT